MLNPEEPLVENTVTGLMSQYYHLGHGLARGS
jgi:hypothetical protein